MNSIKSGQKKGDLTDLDMWRMYSVRPYIPSECADRTIRLLKRIEELEKELDDRKRKTY
jgi:hypothetical protein